MMRMGRRRRREDFLARRNKGMARGGAKEVEYICKLEYRIDAT